ncbi:MAG: S-methyl-5-thioribose-1-phosphate isomerase [Oligoflexus sp.]
MFTAMEFTPYRLRLLDQRYLPTQTDWLECRDLESVAQAIEVMVVRGAPAIATAAAYGLVLHAYAAQHTANDWQMYRPSWEQAVDRLAKTRPTAVNLHHALSQLKRQAQTWANETSLAEVLDILTKFADSLRQNDLETCKAIGDLGASLFSQPISVLTHCNTGSLATAGYGTALGVIRSLFRQGKLTKVWVDETRPYLQGSRLTAFELKEEGIPFSIQVDGAAAFGMKQGYVDMVVVGADRVAGNGDTANKIGTYGLAVAAKHHNVPFYVAAPLSTFDPELPSGETIPIEQRPASEVTHSGRRQISPDGVDVWNPSFDMTPGELITGLITELGVIRYPYTENIRKVFAERKSFGY